MRWRKAVVPTFLLLCLLLGGSSRGIIGPFLLQLLAIGVLGWAALAGRQVEWVPATRRLALLAALALVLIIFQLVPLPPFLWSALPGRGGIAHGYELLGEARPWLPLSLAPQQTVVALMALLPPLAVLGGVLWLGAARRRWLAAALVAGAVLGVLLGALQMASGGDPAISRYYLYRITNAHAAVGFFANANHMATLLLVTLPFLAAAVGRGIGRPGARAATLGIAVPSLLMILLGLMLNDSLAGLLLLVPVAIASSVLLVRRRLHLRGWLLAAAALAGLGAVAGVAMLPSAGTSSVSLDSRREFGAKTIEAIGETMPVGSGFGSFERLYRLHEAPGAVERTYVNHAHNDYLEIALEGGVAAVLLLALFLLWWLQRSVALWRAGSDPYAMAATIASAAMLVHSAVDYPLRTPALAAVFAMCIALMVSPQSRREKESGARRPTRHLGIG